MCNNSCNNSCGNSCGNPFNSEIIWWIIIIVILYLIFCQGGSNSGFLGMGRGGSCCRDEDDCCPRPEPRCCR